MKTYLTVFFAGAMLASTAFAVDDDPFREERLKAKTGRYSQAEEARRQMLTVKAKARTEECADKKCCRSKHGRPEQQAKAIAASIETESFFDKWSRAKWGRNIRRDGRPEAQLAQARPAAASLCADCDHPKCCD